jgi:MoxR-like ATPase
MRPSRIAVDERIARLLDAVNGVVRGKPEVVRRSVVTLLAGGHLLIEDVPGVGKTTLGRSLAQAMGGSFRRIQFTSDLLPGDILGVNVFDPASRSFAFRPGPVFCHVLLADEINRTTPRTQSALLQAMEEHHVTLDGSDHDLPDPFMVIATQNPLEHHGTYPLPESQMDRFLMRLSMGYPAREAERELIRSNAERPSGESGPAPAAELSPETLVAARREVGAVHVAESLLDYVLAIVEGTRVHPDLALGASPRASLALMRAARAAAYLDGRGFVTPDDVKECVEPVLGHRLALRETAPDPVARREQARAVLLEVLERVSVPL